MPWLGKAKKSELNAPTKLQTQKSKQIESLKKGSLSVVETIRDVEYRTTLQVAGNNVTLIITLPPQFPQDGPVVTVEPQVRHPWVDQHMKVTGCANINNFSVHSSLLTAIDAIVAEFNLHPPALVVHTPYSPVSAYPSMYPYPPVSSNPPPPPYSSLRTSGSQDNTNIYTTEQPQTDTTGGSSIPDFSQIDIFQAFPELKNKSRRELYEILEEENKILEIIQEMPQIQTIAEEREKISCKCTDLARENLAQRPAIDEMKQAVKEKADEFERLRSEFERDQEKQLSLMDQFHPSVIQNNLKVAILEADEESEKVVEEFLDKKLDIEEFKQQFLDRRTLYHTRRSQEEKLSQMIISQGYGGV